jgi:hypothetical protein
MRCIMTYTKLDSGEFYLCVTPSRHAKSAALVPVEVGAQARSSLSLAFRVLLFACIHQLSGGPIRAD